MEHRFENVYKKSLEEIRLIEAACRIVAETLSLLEKYVKPETETLELDAIAEDFIRSNDARPAFKGYAVDGKYFPNSLCLSIDEEVVHGLPGKRKLKEGEIISIDCGAEKNGYFGDSAVTYPVGNVSDEKRRLMKITEEALFQGIEKAVAGNKIYDISRAIQTYVESNGYSVTRELVGHGIGKQLHEEPPVPNFVPPLLHRTKYPNIKLTSGMALAIEPMVHQGRKEVVTAMDGWTVVTVDGLPSAHFEHTVIVSDNKPIILTLRN
jgi:methionyl aminopeptidase